MRISQLSALTALLAGLLLGCAHRAFEPSPGAPVTDTRPNGVTGRQALFRVRYRGLDGRGRVRLTVRLANEEFQLAAADTFGRPLWSLAGSDTHSLLLDHRRGEFCRFDGDVVIRAIALSELPVRLLPRVLMGELPFEPPEHLAAVEIDTEDPSGRRWTARIVEDNRLESWTLWQDGRALIWWQRTKNGAILSHRDGAQVIWTLVAEESMTGSLSPLIPPADYGPGQCHESDIS